MERISGIYTVTCIINGKVLVGQSTHTLLRMAVHKSRLKLNKHANKYIQEDWDIYGKENFLFELLEEAEETDLITREHYWCNMLNAHNRDFGYNIQPTAPEGVKRTCNPDELQRLRTAGIGKKLSEEHKRAIGIAGLGRKMSPESIAKRNKTIKDNNLKPLMIAKISKANTGKKRTEESKKLMSEKAKLRTDLLVEVLQYSKNLEYIKTWPSINSIAKHLDTYASQVSICLRKNTNPEKTKYSACKGYILIYKSKLEESLIRKI